MNSSLRGETIVDAHAHWYPGVRLGDLLDRAFDNLNAQRRDEGAVCCVLVFTLTAREHGFDRLQRLADQSRCVAAGGAAWRLTPTGETASLCAARGDDRLWLIAGRQLVSTERLEVHAIGTTADFAAGRPLIELVQDIESAGALAAVPWGTGKWLGGRGRVLRRLLEADGSPKFLLSDSGIRPRGWLRSPLFRIAAARDRAVIAGTDPLPLPGEEARVGTQGFKLDGALDESRPAADLVRRLQAPGTIASGFGRPQPALRFLRTQWRLRRSQAPLPERETPDIETASEDYASRFRGAAGAYFIETQDRSVRHAMHGLSGARVLEVGGGHGQLVKVLGELGCALTAFGSDPVCHERMAARHPGVSIPCVTGDVARLPFADRSFDVVIAVRLISHIERWPALIAEFCRVADRAVVLDYPSRYSLNVLTPLLFALKQGVEKNTRTYLSFTRRQLAREFAQRGFTFTRAYPQFFLPMFVHRALHSPPLLRKMEDLMRMAGLTRLLGSPIVFRAERRGAGAR